jgi:hypothetical protein
LNDEYDIGNIVDALETKRRPIFAPMPTVSVEDDIPVEERLGKDELEALLRAAREDDDDEQG